jgi:hypothetical protein
VAAVVAALGSAAAGAAAAPPVDFSFGFSSTQPGAPADAALYILYKDPENPDDPDGQPPALTRVEVAAPSGTVFDGTAVPACLASNDELMLRGAAACPEPTGVGNGFASVVNAFGPPLEPFTADVTLFNYGDGIIELLRFEGAINVVDRARFESPSTMVLNPPVVPGITEREFRFAYRGMPRGAGKAFITTPPDCPPSRMWTSRLTYTVTTGATYSAESATPCTPAAAGRPAAIRATLRPRRVRAGRRVRIDVTLRSSDARCVANASVRLAGHRPVRTDRAGRATIVARFRRPGRSTVTAAKRGCASGRTALTVLRPR